MNGGPRVAFFVFWAFYFHWVNFGVATVIAIRFATV